MKRQNALSRGLKERFWGKVNQIEPVQLPDYPKNVCLQADRSWYRCVVCALHKGVGQGAVEEGAEPGRQELGQEHPRASQRGASQAAGHVVT